MRRDTWAFQLRSKAAWSKAVEDGLIQLVVSEVHGNVRSNTQLRSVPEFQILSLIIAKLNLKPKCFFVQINVQGTY